MLDTIPHSDFWALQETHASGQERLAAMKRWARKRGWAAHFQAAEETGLHSAANRGGVALVGPLHISTEVPASFDATMDDAAFMAPAGVQRPLDYLRSRILARHFHAMLKGGVTLVTVYLEPGIKASGLNLWMLEALAAFCLGFDGPWIAMGDWNMDPAELAQSGWADMVGGKVVAPDTVTCAGGAGSLIDYFVVSAAIAQLVQQVKVIDESPTTPHWPVRLTLKAATWGHKVLARRRPKAFPTELPIGPRQKEAPFDWTWEEGNLPANLEQAWLEWLRAAEAAWCRIHDLCGAQRRPYLGRSKGLVIQHVTLGQATRCDARSGGSRQAAAWRSLRRLVAQAVGSLSAWRKGRVSLAAALRALYIVATTALPDLGPWDPGWVFASQGALSQALSSALTSASWADIAKQAMVFVSHHTQQAINAAASASARAWRTWAKEACQGSGGAGHGFAKLVPDDGEQGLAGPQLLVQQMRTWLPLWLDGRRANAKQLGDQEDWGEPLPRPSLQEVDGVCKDIQELRRVGTRLHQP